MYKAQNGFILHDNTAPGGGWIIQKPEDIITALLSYPYFQDVYTGFLWEALAQAVEARKEYADIKDLAQFIAENYI